MFKDSFNFRHFYNKKHKNVSKFECQYAINNLYYMAYLV